MAYYLIARPVFLYTNDDALSLFGAVETVPYPTIYIHHIQGR